MTRTLVCLALALLCSCRPVNEQDAATGAKLPATSATPAKAPEAPAVEAPAPAPVRTTWILPGDFSADTTLRDLQQRFGASNVAVQEIPGAEGESSRGVVLFPDDPGRRATVYFQDPQNLLGLAMVSIDEDHSQWKLVSGIGIGIPLSELRRINGKPFTFSGFDWDYGGTIIDWQRGKLAPANDEAVSARVQLRMPQGDVGDRAYPQGDSRFFSDDPRWKDLGITVGGFSVSFPGEDDL
ncbi:MAG: hypothetical protein ABI538_06160 [Pseudoxanthomonas sp.]